MKKKPQHKKRPDEAATYDLESTVSMTEMTGLMAAPPEDEAEREHYKELLTYTPTKHKKP